MPMIGMPDFQNTLYESLKPQNRPAQWAFEQLVEEIVEFEKQLNSDEEIGGRFVSAPIEGAISIENVGYRNPSMIVFVGKNADGRPVRLLQHHSQLSVLLVALAKQGDQPARRIGFDLEHLIKSAK